MADTPIVTVPATKAERAKKRNKKSGQFIHGWKGGGGTSEAARWRSWVENFRKWEVTSDHVRQYWQELIDFCFNPKYPDSLRLKALEMFGDRLYGKPKVTGELEITQTTHSFEQRLVMAQVASQLIRQPIQDDGTVIDGTFTESRPLGLPAPADPVPAVRPDGGVGDLLSPQRSEREVLHREQQPNLSPTVEAQDNTPVEDAPQPLPPVVVEQIER